MASGKFKYKQGESLGPAKSAIHLAIQDIIKVRRAQLKHKKKK